MAISEAIHSLRLEIQQNLIERNLGENPEERWLAPHDLATRTLKPQLLRLFKLLYGNNVAEQQSEHLEEYCKVLLILLGSECNAGGLQQALEHGGIRDLHLPVERARAVREFGESLGAEFHRRQFLFCPVILRDGKEERYLGEMNQHCPLPFESREKLGGGSSGSVYKVKIIAGHFYPEENGMGPNDEPRCFAWKEFTQCRDPEEAYRIERENLEIIRNSPDIRLEDNIMLARGSLLRGTTYSLLFDPADCDLGQYLSDTSTFIPISTDDVESFLCRFKGLVAALNFLHTKLVTIDTEDDLCFAHLDLRPANILVFNKGIFDRSLGIKKTEIWKIHDFGVSRIRRASPPARTIFKWLLPGPIEDQVSPSTRDWPEGTFYAPETQPGIGNKVTELKPASDIWSLGCILSLVISFIDDGPRSIEQFQKERISGRSTKDPFYVKRGDKFLLNPGVTTWFKILENRIEKRTKDDRESLLRLVVRDTVLLLKKCLLVIKPDKRANAQDVKQAFQDILSRFKDSGARNSGVKAELKLLIDRFKNKSSDAMKDPTPPPVTFQLEKMPKEPNSCKYSLRGDYLAFLSARDIVVYNVVGVLCKNAHRIPQSRTPIGGATWGGFDLCSKYLVAYTNNSFLDFYLYPHSPLLRTASSPQHPQHFSHEKMPPVKKISLSPNGEHFVMVLRRRHEPHSIYACSVKNIQEASENLETTRPQWNPQLLNPINPETNTRFHIGHVESVQFSEDSKLITLLSQPIGSNIQVFYGWSWNEASNKYEYVNSIEFTLPGNIDTSETWITAFIPLMPKLSILKVTFQNVISQSGFVTASMALDWKSQELKRIQILDVLPLSHTDRHCIFIGRESRKKGTIKALYAEVTGLRDKLDEVHFDYVLDLGCSDWVPSRDSASTLSDGEIFLVSTAKGSGCIRKVFRPKAPII